VYPFQLIFFSELLSQIIKKAQTMCPEIHKNESVKLDLNTSLSVKRKVQKKIIPVFLPPDRERES